MDIQLIEDKINQKGSNKAAVAKEMGMSKQSFNAFLKSDNPTLQKLQQLSAVLSLTVAELIGETNTPRNTNSDFAAFVRFKGIHYTADTLEEFNIIVEEIKSISR